MSIAHVCGAPTRWDVTMKSGAVVAVWADAVREQDGAHVFEVLVDAEGELPDYTLVTARTPSNPDRLAIAVASFRVADVDDIGGG